MAQAEAIEHSQALLTDLSKQLEVMKKSADSFELIKCSSVINGIFKVFCDFF
jgi:hypothetical protein